MPLSTNFHLYRGGQPTFPGNNILSTNINTQNNHISFKIIKYKKNTTKFGTRNPLPGLGQE